VLRAFVLGFVEALPLPVFLVYSRFIDTSVSAEWLGPYLVSSVLALMTAYVVWRYVGVFNRVFVAINLYFLSGAAGLLMGVSWLNQFYGRMEAAGMLLWVIGVFAVAWGVTRKGALGVSCSGQHKDGVYSALLLGVAVVAFLLSLYFQGNRVLAEFLPFVLLFSVYAVLRKQLEGPVELIEPGKE